MLGLTSGLAATSLALGGEGSLLEDLPSRNAIVGWLDSPIDAHKLHGAPPAPNRGRSGREEGGAVPCGRAMASVVPAAVRANRPSARAASQA